MIKPIVKMKLSLYKSIWCQFFRCLMHSCPWHISCMTAQGTHAQEVTMHCEHY